MEVGEVNEILILFRFKNSVWNKIKRYESKQVIEEGVTRKKDENKVEIMLLTLQNFLNF
jgi:hypothetical protein